MLHLREIRKTYNGTAALEPLSLEMQRGKTTALLGPSGCGKSTLLRIIVGLVEPDQGTVSLDGIPITRANRRQMRHRMGYVIQDGGLFPHLTVRRNIVILAEHLGWPQQKVEQRLEQLRVLAHLPADMLLRYPAQLSGGQQQRVSLLRALFLDPDVLLLDEPLGALDPMIRSELQTELREIFQRLGKTVVLVTHDIGEAGYLSDLIVLLRAGRIVQRGTLNQLIEQPADPFVSDFINAQRTPIHPL